MVTNPTVGRAFNFQLPTGIVFDPVNQVFLVANSLQNNAPQSLIRRLSIKRSYKWASTQRPWITISKQAPS